MRQTSLGRRDFLKILACCGAAGLAVKAGVDSIGGLEQVSETRLLMGTLVNLTVISENPVQGRRAMRAGLERMEGLEMVLSRFRPESQLSQLNREGRLARADTALIEVFTLAQQVSEWSAGAFDVTIKPLVDAYFRAHERAALPAPDEIAAAQRLVDYRRVSVGSSSVRFGAAGAAATLDGIAKGYIIDRGVEALRAAGCEHVFVEAGGDLFACGEKTPGRAWEVGVLAPRPGGGRILARFPLVNRAAATSGDYQQAFASDYSAHHILDPRSGYSSRQLASATVQAGSAALADALATAVMVLGVDEGMRLIGDLPGCEALLVTKDLEIIRSAAFGSGLANG